MKRLTAFTLLSKTCMLAALLLSACNKENDPAPEVVVRPACRVTKSVYSVSAMEPNSGYENYSQYEYDIEGKLLKEVIYVSGKEAAVVTFQHNGKGQVIEQVTKEYGIDAQQNATTTTRTYTLAYNQQGQVLNYQTVITSTDPSVTQGIYASTCEYDSQGNRIRITTTNPKGVTNVTAYEYKDGNCTKAAYQLGESTELNVVYEYYPDRDNKSRYYHKIYRAIYNATPNKNLVKKSVMTNKTSSEYISIDEYTYEYTSLGFPRQTVVTSSNRLTNSPHTYITSDEYACQ